MTGKSYRSRGAHWSKAQYDAYCARRGASKPATPRKVVKPVKGKKTKTESDFELRLKRQHPSLTILYEPLKLRIDQSCWYLPDFWVPELHTFFEVKGPHIWEDSIIKFKAARAIHTWARFECWQKRGGDWRQIRKLPGEEGLE